MKKVTFALMLVALCLLLCSCTSLGYIYTDAGDYTAGGASLSQRVEDIDINWVDGSVSVAYHDGDEIVLSESSDQKLTTDTKLHWQVDGRKLYVKYAASGLRSLPGLNKQLTVLLPEGLQLDDVKIAVASADVEADGLNADEIHLQSASGRIALRQRGKAEEIKVDTASGGVAVAVEDADKMTVKTASGQVIVDAYQLDQVNAATASGSVTLQFANAPDKIDADAVSGNVTIRLPKDAGFTMDLDSVSGAVGGDLPMERKDDDIYVYGNGSCRVEVNSVSGNVMLEENVAAAEQQI